MIQLTHPLYSIRNKLFYYFGSIFLVLVLFGYFTIRAFETTLEVNYLNELKSKTKNLSQQLSEYDPSNPIGISEKTLLDYRVRTNPLDVLITDIDFNIIRTLNKNDSFSSSDLKKELINIPLNEFHILSPDTLIYIDRILMNNSPFGLVISLFSSNYIESHISSDLRTVKTVMGGGLILFVITAVIGLQFLQITVSSPLRILAQNIQEVAEDNLNTRMDIVRKDEFGQIAKIFNEMVERLRKNRQVIKQFNIELASRVEKEVAKSIELEKKVSRNQRLTSLGHLSASIAHELYNPLNTILMSSKLLEEDIEIKQNLQNVERIIRNTDRAIRLIKDLTEYSWLIPVKPELTPLKPILNKTLEVFFPRCERKNISLQMKYLSKTNKIPLVTKNIERVFINVLQNAIDAVKEDGRIDIFVTDRKKQICIDFQDSGPGIKPKDLERIYEPFFSTKDHGTGIGLFLSYEIIMTHGGDIQVQNIMDPRSGLTRGTQVKIFLPKNHQNLNQNTNI